ncbi:hypothetical protein FR698_09045 [Pelomicrobium methylotrophicum]|uniref:Uncharacterized protein n=1 Tax=Pelomicrobium methylotrophicum TaxID=2602750 RepID=A0A5C7EUI9_9PROT|nr:hypothetical protein FR698_09045 [Pelomicrobium methylotrophicum]
MTHDEFVSAYRSGALRVKVDRAAAEKLLARRLLLPLVALPVLGIGVALALIGHLWLGILVFLLGFVGPRLIKRSAPNFIVTQALRDAAWYADALQAGVLKIEDPAERPR